MNIRELEALLSWIDKTCYFPYCPEVGHKRVQEAIKYCQRRRKAAATRKAIHRLRADEQRELLR